MGKDIRTVALKNQAKKNQKKDANKTQMVCLT